MTTLCHCLCVYLTWRVAQASRALWWRCRKPSLLIGRRHEIRSAFRRRRTVWRLMVCPPTHRLEVSAAVWNRCLKCEVLIARSSAAVVTRGRPGRWRSFTEPVCCFFLFGLSIVIRWTPKIYFLKKKVVLIQFFFSCCLLLYSVWIQQFDNRTSAVRGEGFQNQQK